MADAQVTFQDGKGFRINCGHYTTDDGTRQPKRWWLGFDQTKATELATRIRAEWALVKLTGDVWPTDTLQRLTVFVTATKNGLDPQQVTTTPAPAPAPAQPTPAPTQPALTPLPPVANGWMLYAAIDDWCQCELKRNGISPAQQRKPSDTLHWIKKAMTDRPLSAVRYEDIQQIVNHMKGRPVSSQTGKPLSVESTAEVIKQIKRFFEQQDTLLRWDRCRGFDGLFDWDKHAALTVTERKQKARKPTFSLQNLSDLYAKALPHQRLYELLGLLGFYQSDIGSLTNDEIMPRDGMLALLKEYGWNDDDIEGMRKASQPGDWFICRFRNKTGQWGCWLLWPETLSILRKLEAEDNTKGPDGTNLQLLGSKGNPLWHWKKGKTDAIRQHWEKLLDVYEGPRLTLKYLRKTGANLIIKYLPRQNETDRLAQTLMAQAEDENSKSTVARRHYLNSDFALLTEALRKLHTYLRPMFCGVPATGGIVLKKAKTQALAAEGLKLQ